MCSYITVLQRCAKDKALAEGKRLHAYLNNTATNLKMVVQNNIIIMYVKCGEIEDALRVFNRMEAQNVFTWTALIVAYAQSGRGRNALNLFGIMQLHGVKPNEVTFSSVLSACVDLANPNWGRWVHAKVLRAGYFLDPIIACTLINMYSKCGSIEDSCHVFENIPVRTVCTWTSMIAGYNQHGKANEALHLFTQMKTEGIQPNEMTLVSVLNASSSTLALQEGKLVHALILHTRHQADVFIGSALVDMYAKCGCIGDAQQVFVKMRDHDIVSWNAMLAGYAQYGNCAIEFFQVMHLEGMKPDKVTFVAVLNGCARVSALELGKHFHYEVLKAGWEADIFVATALIDMYANCGNLESIHGVFKRTVNHDVGLWNAIITAYAQFGDAVQVLKMFEQMQQEFVFPNHITFISLLSACSHGCLLDEGRKYFHSMVKDHGITPRIDHYACMVDLLGRAGFLDEAERLINKVEIESADVAWMCLLNAYKIHGEIKRAEYAIEQFKLEHSVVPALVLLCNMYAAAGRWEDVVNMKQRLHCGMKGNGLKPRKMSMSTIQNMPKRL